MGKQHILLYFFFAFHFYVSSEEIRIWYLWKVQSNGRSCSLIEKAIAQTSNYLVQIFDNLIFLLHTVFAPILMQEIWKKYAKNLTSPDSAFGISLTKRWHSTTKQNYRAGAFWFWFNFNSEYWIFLLLFSSGPDMYHLGLATEWESWYSFLLYKFLQISTASSCIWKYSASLLKLPASAHKFLYSFLRSSCLWLSVAVLTVHVTKKFILIQSSFLRNTM